MLVDSAVAICALGAEHPYRDSCRTLWGSVPAGTIRAYAGTEMIQEVVRHRLRRTGTRAPAVADGRDVAGLCTLLNVDREVLELSLDVVAGA